MQLKHWILVSLLIIANMVTAHQDLTHSIKTWADENHIPGVSIQIYDHGQLHAYYVGVSSRATQQPVVADTIFEIGSITKIFTALLLAQQSQLKNVTLDATLNQYLPDLTADTALQTATIANLATYTAGLPFEVPDTITTRLQLAKYFKNWQPDTPIGTHRTYSNVSIGLLGYTLERITHRNINQLYRHDLLLPLKMLPIGITVPKKWQRNYAQGYDDKNQPVIPRGISLFPAAYAMKLSARDSQTFLRAALGLSANKTITDAMQFTQTPWVQVSNWQQGLVWEVHCKPLESKENLLNPGLKMSFNASPVQTLSVKLRQFDNKCLFDKTGGTDGFRSYLAVIPGQKTGVFIMINHYVDNGVLVKKGREILFQLLNK
jgi:beta-lactamase class C